MMSLIKRADLGQSDLVTWVTKGPNGPGGITVAWSQYSGFIQVEALLYDFDKLGCRTGMTTFYIKNMVCNRCIMVVRQQLENTGFHPEQVLLGEVTLREETVTPEQWTAMDQALKAVGFERIDDRKSRLIESIKNEIIKRIHDPQGLDRKSNWSTLLSESLHYEYNYLSSLFSSVEGITLEQYIIRQKIERVKELLFYDERNLSEIAHLLGYSSVAHLSSQFKKVTGLTPSDLKKSRSQDVPRKPVDHVN